MKIREQKQKVQGAEPQEPNLDYLLLEELLVGKTIILEIAKLKDPILQTDIMVLIIIINLKGIIIR